MQQLTHLSLVNSLQADVEGNPPAAAYAVLTASSKLQSLNINGCTLPAGAWQQIFPAGRQLPYLQSLNIAVVRDSSSDWYAPAPQGSLLVSCCPGLQSLDMRHLQYSAELLAPLQELSGLQEQCLGAHNFGGQAEGFAAVCPGVVCKLTQLQKLTLSCPHTPQEILPYLTSLQHLTTLGYYGPLGSGRQGPLHR